MNEKWYKKITSQIEERYNSLPEKITRREALGLSVISALGGATLMLAATEIGNETKDTVDDSEKEQWPHFATGIDISHPQGSAERYASMRMDFVVVGVNGGRPTDVNPYLVEQLRVASVITQDADVQQTGMLPIQLYLNTANPADHAGEPDLSTWPTSEDVLIPYNPYANEAVCDGTDNQACMYVYGWQRARQSVENMFVPAAHEAGVSADPTTYTWWLDVEDANSWRERPRPDEVPQESNRAVLEGMVAYIHSTGAGVGLYSSRDSWDKIIGESNVTETSNLYSLPSWLAIGPDTEEEAKERLMDESERPFTAGGNLAIVQRVEGEGALDPDALDYNYAVAKPLS